MSVTNWDQLPKNNPFPGVEVAFISGGHVMVNHVHAEKGGIVRRHHHEAEQIFCLIGGSARVQAGEEPVTVLKPGDVWYVAGDVEHQVDFLEDCVAFEAVGPIRLDHFAGYMKQHTFPTKHRNLAALMKKQKRSSPRKSTHND